MKREIVYQIIEGYPVPYQQEKYNIPTKTLSSPNEKLVLMDRGSSSDIVLLKMLNKLGGTK